MIILYNLYVGIQLFPIFTLLYQTAVFNWSENGQISSCKKVTEVVLLKHKSFLL